MTPAAELLVRCRTLGVTLVPTPAGTLEWEADTAPPDDLLNTLAAHKHDLLALLTLTPDQYELWEERVCIMHFDGMIPWQTAEGLALADILGHAAPHVVKPKAAPTVQKILFPAEEKSPYDTC